MVAFSVPCLSRKVMDPSSIPRARYSPSLVQDRHRARLCVLCFTTLFSSGDQSPKSDAVALASWCVTGLNSTASTESLWLYFRMPSALSVQTITFLSAEPEAKRSPEAEYDTE